jgi:predicted nucleotidyltransferase
MQTPNIYRVLAERLKRWESSFRDYIRKLCKEDIVIEAYLVGSRARGDNLPYSDYDVVVIVPDGIDKLDAVVKLRRLRNEPFPLDLIVLNLSDVRDPIFKRMLEEGVRLCNKGS